VTLVTCVDSISICVCVVWAPVSSYVLMRICSSKSCRPALWILLHDIGIAPTLSTGAWLVSASAISVSPLVMII